MTGCTVDPTDLAAFPFEYKGHDGQAVHSGTLVEGVCILNNTACSLSAKLCCGLSKQADGRTSKLWLIPFVCYLAPYYLFVGYRKRQGKQLDQERKAKGLPGEESKNPLAHLLKDWTVFQKNCFKATLILALAATIAEAVIMPKSIQQTLQPPETSALLAMSSFLTPVEEIFAFIEDVMVVEVGYAVAGGDYKRLNLLLNISVVGGIVSALFAVSLVLIISLQESAAEALLNPSSAQNQKLIDSGCDLISTGPQLLEVAKVYWLLTALAWIPKFAIKGVFGFFIGTGYLSAYIAPMFIMSSVPLGIWFGLKDSMSPLSVVGLAYGTADWLVSSLYQVQ
jgi:type IV secretory pathway VirB2 component (pilin)